MKTLKFFIAFMLLANAFALTAQNTNRQRPNSTSIEQEAAEMTDNILPGITLTNEQKEALLPYTKTFLTQRPRTDRQSNSGQPTSAQSRREDIAEKQTINKEFQDALNNILTPEQKQQLREYLKQRREETIKNSVPVNRPY